MDYTHGKDQHFSLSFYYIFALSRSFEAALLWLCHKVELQIIDWACKDNLCTPLPFLLCGAFLYLYERNLENWRPLCGSTLIVSVDL